MIMHNFIGKYTNPSRKIEFMPEAGQLTDQPQPATKIIKAGFCKPANKSTN